MPHSAQSPAYGHRTAPTAGAIFVPVFVVLLGLLLRMAMLGIEARFHPDEALFAAQSRLIVAQGDWLLRTTDLDKPPLTFYVTALSFSGLPVSEFAARLPNVLFSGMSVALLYTLARVLYHNRTTATVAALLFALSPYDLAFAATVFTDVQATFWVLAAGTLAARDNWRGAGLAAALMFAAKSTALLFLPLILALGITRTASPDWRPRDLLQRLRAFAWPLLAGIALLLAWDLARAPRSFFALGFERNDPGRLIRTAELWPRARQWVHWLGFATGSQALNGILLIGIPAMLLLRLRERSRATIADWLIAGYAIAFLGWYWLVAFNTYDRYVHTLIPFILLLAARLLTGAWHIAGARMLTLLALLALVTGSMAPAVITTLHGDAPLGGDQGRHAGIDALAGFLNAELAGETIYEHQLGWELAFYLGPAPRVTLHYVPLPDALADNMRAATAPRYFAAASPPQAAPWLAALERAGIVVAPVYHDRINGFVVYGLLPP